MGRSYARSTIVISKYPAFAELWQALLDLCTASPLNPGFSRPCYRCLGAYLQIFRVVPVTGHPSFTPVSHGRWLLLVVHKGTRGTSVGGWIAAKRHPVWVLSVSIAALHACRSGLPEFFASSCNRIQRSFGPNLETVRLPSPSVPGFNIQTSLCWNDLRVVGVHFGLGCGIRCMISPEAELVRVLGVALVVEVMPMPGTHPMEELGGNSRRRYPDVRKVSTRKWEYFEKPLWWLEPLIRLGGRDPRHPPPPKGQERGPTKPLKLRVPHNKHNADPTFLALPELCFRVIAGRSGIIITLIRSGTSHFHFTLATGAWA